MNEPSTSIIATNITLVTVSLLATSLVVVYPTWKRFRRFWMRASKDSLKTVLNVCVVSVGLPAVIVASGMVSLAMSPTQWHLEWPYVTVLVLLALTLPVVLYGIWHWIRTKPRNQREVNPLELNPLPPEIGAASALGSFLIVIVIALTIITAAVPSAIEVDIGGDPKPEDFEYARAMILVMPLVLLNGFAWLGFSFVMELLQRPVGATNHETSTHG